MIALLVGILQLGAPSSGSCVFDEAGVLTSSEVSSLESDCRSMPGRLFLVAASSTRGQGDAYALTLFREWAVRSDGLLVMVAPRDRKWRIVVGSTLKGAISDAKAADIGRSFGVPAFKNGLWGTGLISIEKSLVPLMRTYAPTPPIVTRRTETTTTRRIVSPGVRVVAVHHDLTGLWIFLGIAGVMILIFFTVSMYQNAQEESAARLRREEEERLRRAAAASRPRRTYDDDPPPERQASYQRTAPAPVRVPAPAAQPSPIIVPIPIAPSYPVPIPVVQPMYQRPAVYVDPVIVVDRPIYSPPVVIEETTSRVVEEVVTRSNDEGGAGGGWGSGGDDSPGGSGGDFDSSSSSSDSDSGSSSGGDGGDF